MSKENKNNFELYLQGVVGKIGPQAAFDLSRDAKFGALQAVLIKHGIATKEEIEYQMEQELSRLVEIVQKMPPLPTK